MTTNHRPTLESKRGKEAVISNTISHSRSLPQHTSLKYRSDIRKPKVDTKIGKQAVEELKKDLLLNEGRFEDSLKIKKSLNDKNLLNDVCINETIGNKNNEKDNEHNENSITNDERSSSEYASDDDSEDETAELMAELAKIKKERQEEKEKEKEKLELQNKIDKTKFSNPLVPIPGTSSEANFKIKKSWRNSTAFKKQNALNKAEDEVFTNDTLNSEFHQSFLTKYIR